MLVKVTQEDIDNAVKIRNDGTKGLSKNCPIALALQKTFNLPLLSVGLNEKMRACTNCIEHSPEVCDFVDNFDKKLEVHPFEFEYELPLF